MSKAAAGLPRIIALAMLLAGYPLPSSAADWPSGISGEAMATVAFTTQWAETLRTTRDFAEIQKAAGSPGQLILTQESGESPHAIYLWHGAGGRGQMRVTLYGSGDFGIVLTPADNEGEIIFNNFDAFFCPGCSPPVHACGMRPSWVSHAFHWNEYDCGCTLTGPQTIGSGPC